jgi:hypothetical protein
MGPHKKMMQRSTRIFILGSICVLLLSGCRDEREIAFAQLIPINDINDTLTLSILNSAYDPRKGYDIDLLLENHSKNSISLPSDYGVMLLVYSDQDYEWIDLDNQMSYFPEESRFLSPRENLASSRKVFGVRPDIVNVSEMVELRIVVLGNILIGQAQTNQQVAAFVDVELLP